MSRSKRFQYGKICKKCGRIVLVESALKNGICLLCQKEVENEFVTEKLKQDAELKCIKTGLKAVEILCDKEK